MTKKNVFTIALLGLMILTVPAISAGQTSSIGNSLSMVLVPQNPEPSQNVRASLESYGYDIDRAQITWFVNDQEKNTGIGLKEFSFLAGKNGEKTTIKAVVVPLNKTQTQIEKTFTPSSLDLIYESLSYVPPFYKGRAMNPNQGVVLVAAIPNLIDKNGVRVSTRDIIYSWKKDGKVQRDSSGVGKNTFIFSGGVPIRDTEIEVTISSLDASTVSSKKITISSYQPKIVFYENSAIYGIMNNRAIRSQVQLFNDEFSLVAIPYFFSIGYTATPDLDYTWTLNGKTVGNQDPKNYFTVRQETKGSGTADIGLKIGNSARIFQFTNNGISINFEKQ